MISAAGAVPADLALSQPLARSRTASAPLAVTPLAFGAPVVFGGAMGFLYPGDAPLAVLLVGAVGYEEMCLRSTWRTLGLSVVALGVWAVVGVAIGTVITNQVAAIVVLVAFTQFLEPILRTVLALTSWGKSIGKFLPGSAGEAITGGSFYTASGLGQRSRRRRPDGSLGRQANMRDEYIGSRLGHRRRFVGIKTVRRGQHPQFMRGAD